MVTAWLLFPLVLMVVCVGCGLTVERIGGWCLPGTLLPAAGLSVVIVSATLTTSRSTTAPLTTAVVVALAAIGYAASWRRLRLLRADPWMLGVGLAVFAIAAAPVVLSGNATFLGYFVDSDQAVHFELISWILAHGHQLAGVPAVSPSAVANLLREYIGTAYPIGADVALGAVRPLVGQDIAWIFQPYLAVVLALGAVALGELLKGVTQSRPLRFACALIAAQPVLAYALYLEASVKELVVALLITVTVVLVLEALRGPLRLRRLAPLTVVVIAGLDVYSLTIVPWLGVPLAVCGVGLAWRARQLARRRSWRSLSWRAASVPLAAAVVVLLCLPVLSGAATFATVASGVLSQQNTLGNLAAPLPKLEILGIWPNGDFRFPTQNYPGAYILIGVAIAGAVLGLVWLLRRRFGGPLLLLLGNGIAAVYLLNRASPYAASKVLMILSVSVLLTAMLGAAGLHGSGRRVEGWLLAAAIAVGVLWSNLLAYHDSSVAPQARFRELAAIGQRFSGRGPAFYDLWDTLPVYFLRTESVAVPDTFAGPAPQRAGLPSHAFGQPSSPWDPNNLNQRYLQSFRLLVLGRSPLLSRPPADYRLAYRGQYYDVWERTPRPTVIRHIALSDGSLAPSRPASCKTIQAIAALAHQDHARVAYVPRVSLPTLMPAAASHPANWSPMNIYGRAGFLALGQSDGTLSGTLRIAAPGRYQVWLAGSVSRHLIIRIGGRLVGSVRHQIGTAGQFLHVGAVYLQPGLQQVQIERPGSYYAPGNVVGGELLGPLVLVPGAFPPEVREIPARNARVLCGKSLEWVEVVA